MGWAGELWGRALTVALALPLAAGASAALAGVSTYKYNPLGQLESASTSSDNTTYVYDNSGNRVSNGTPNSCPTAKADATTGVAGTPVTLVPLANDTDPDADDLTLVSLGVPDQGGTVIINSDDKTITYTALHSFAGTEKFTYQVTDGLCVKQATVTAQVPFN